MPRRLVPRTSQLFAPGLIAAGTLLLALLAAGNARADDPIELPPWAMEAVPAWASSVVAVDGDQSIFSEPSADAPRRGTAMKGARLPLFGAAVGADPRARRELGAGCRGAWLSVGASAWMCQADVQLSRAAAQSSRHAAAGTSPDGLPLRYYFAGPDGSFGYRRLSEADVGEPTMTLEPGFAVAIVAERTLSRERYGLTKQGLWVPMRDLGRARSFTFRGEAITSDTTLPLGSMDRAPKGRQSSIPFAWVVVDKAPLFVRRGAVISMSGQWRARFDKVGWLEEARSLGTEYARIDEANWIRVDDVRHPTMALPPPEVAVEQREHWIDIELASQTLVAYEGGSPVFATLVSTGKGKTPGHPFETPTGTHRIWVKLLTTTMDNLEDENAGRYYRIEDVPYVQYFDKAVGLHAAFWHRSFGHIRSHGCVNLAPLDAERLFWWTGPRLPAGWSASLPTRFDLGTIVRVR